MNTVVWIFQLLLAGFFAMPAFMKLSFSKQKLIEKQILQPGQSLVFPRALGTLELLGILGIILPVLTNILPVLTAYAAIGFALIMSGALVIHTKKKDYKMLPVFAIVLILSLIVTTFRW